MDNGKQIKVEKLGLSPLEVSVATGLSLSTVRTAIREGRIPAVRLSPRRILVSKKVLEDLLANGLKNR
ncbi:MAG: helix-turn-helix domain-containing protein [Dehalococcoidia bacterium]|nr:helix-turn-helix domain-containing protein [Dehalococcoidia bacterium]